MAIVNAAVLFTLIVLTLLELASAGEIVLYSRKDCTGLQTIFAADTSTDCRQAEQTVIGPSVYSASTSRNIGQSCKFNLYTDTKCQEIAGTIPSSGPAKKCLPIAKGVQSYQITCKGAVAANIARPNQVQVTLNNYFQPLVTYRGNQSGNDSISGQGDFCGSYIDIKPTGNPSAVGTKLSLAFFSKIPTGAKNFSTTVTDGGTLYRIELDGHTSWNFTAYTAASMLGMSAFASLMSDTVTFLVNRPCDYYTYAVYDTYDVLGRFNMSYTVL